MAELETAERFLDALSDHIAAEFKDIGIDLDMPPLAALVEARDKAVALRAKRSLLLELDNLVTVNKWADVKGGKEAAWGRAYSKAFRELTAKYQDKP